MESIKDTLGAVACFEFRISGFWSAGAEESLVTNERPEPRKENLCFAGTTIAGQQEL